MTSLDLISENYSSSSDDDDSSVLTLPHGFNFCEDKENSDLHQGRVRSFKHEQGNWATHIYFVYPQSLTNELKKFSTELFNELKDWFVFDEFHISLSRTFPIPFHFIDPIVQSLKQNHETFNVQLSATDLRFYTNDEKTRTFIGFEITDVLSSRKISKIVSKIDKILKEYKCEEYYSEHSFHVSIAWRLGNVDDQHLLESLKLKFVEFEIENPDLFDFNVLGLNLKAGNKLFYIKF